MENTKILKLFGYQSLDTISKLGLNFIASIFFARIFGPDIIGQYAIIFFYYALFITIGESGISQIAIKANDVGKRYYLDLFKILSTIFISITSLFILYIGFVEYDFVNILYTIPLISFFEIFSAIPKIKLYRELNYKTLFKCTIISEITSGITTVILYCTGVVTSGLYLMMLYLLIKQLISFLSLYLFNNFKSFLRNIEKKYSQKVDVKSSFKILFMSILDSIYRNMYSLILTQKGYDNRNIGIYSRVDNLGKLSTSLLATVVQKVTLPIFSKLDYKSEIYGSLFKVCLKFFSLLSVYISCSLMLFSYFIVIILYGDEFYEVGSYIKPVLFMTVLFPINAILINEYILSSKFNELYVSEFTRKAIGLILMFYAAHISLYIFSWTIGVWGVVSTFINIYLLGDRLDHTRSAIYLTSIKSLIFLILTYIVSITIKDISFLVLYFFCITTYFVIELLKINESFRKISYQFLKYW